MYTVQHVNHCLPTTRVDSVGAHCAMQVLELYEDSLLSDRLHTNLQEA
jgi:hypothetical protein